MADTSDTNKLICPKCGSEKITVKRERAGTSYSGKSGGASVRIGRVRVSGGEHGGNSTNHYRTVAVCNNCGFTWMPNASSDSVIKKICLWVIFLPFMLSLWLWKTDKIKDKRIKYGAIAAIWVIPLLCSAFGVTSSDSAETTAAAKTSAVTTAALTEAEKVSKANLIYEKNDRINRFLEAYNVANPDDVITSDMFSVYHHHGQDHENQIIFRNKDGYELVITDSAFGIETHLTTYHREGKPDESKTFDEYKEEFFKFAKAYNKDFTVDTLEAYWKQVLEHTIHSPDFQEFEVSMRIEHEEPKSLQITGKFK